MTTRRAALLTATVMVLSSCAPPPTTQPPSELPTSPFADCPSVSSGDVTLSGVETDPDYERSLILFEVGALPAELSLSGLSSFQALLVRYMLQVPSEIVTVAPASVSGPLALSAMAAFDSNGSVDTARLRQGLHRFYACDRGFPETLAGFLAEFHDFRDDPVAQLVDSKVKALPRRIRRNGDLGIFVAETLDGDVVRETEIILTDRRGDGGIDFLEYDVDGILRGASTFAAASGEQTTGPVPFSCIACHGTNVVSPPPPP